MPTDTKIIKHLQSLPEKFWDFKKEDVRVGAHGFHQYPAIMVCPISRHIIQFMQDILPITSLLDPFMGSGTVLVEGILAGVPSICGNDLNPMAVLMAKVKTTPLDAKKLFSTYRKIQQQYNATITKYASTLQQVDTYITDNMGLDIFGKNAWSKNAQLLLKEYNTTFGIETIIPTMRNMGYWFKPRTINELAILRDILFAIQEHDQQQFFLLAFSESIRFVSNRRNGEFKMFRMPVEKLRAFKPDVWQQFSTIATRNIEKMNNFVHTLPTTHSAITIGCGDTLHMEGIPDNFYDLIVTSPPYGDSRTTVAYGEFSRLSSSWLKLAKEEDVLALDKKLLGGTITKETETRDLRSKTLNASLQTINAIDPVRGAFVHAFYSELNEAIAEIARKTKPGGYHFWVVGNRTVKKEQLLTDSIIRELAGQHGLYHVATSGRTISNKVMPSRNSPTNETGKQVATMTNEHIVVLRKG